MAGLNRDLVLVIKGVTSCLTAAFLVFFISALSGEDLLKNHSTIKDLDRIQGRDLGGAERRHRAADPATGRGPEEEPL